MLNITVILPLYNEQELFPFLPISLEKWKSEWKAKHPGRNVNILAVNDGSIDDTWCHCEQWAKSNSDISLINLGRNFGHQAAMTAGLDNCPDNQIICFIDADLQDPLYVMEELISKVDEGFDIAYGVRTNREGESWFKKTTASVFYWLMKQANPWLPKDSGDFCALSPMAVATFRQMREAHRYLRGMRAWIGLKQTPIPYRREIRSMGESHYGLVKMLRLAGDALLSFSPWPLRLISLSGVITAGAGAIYGIYALAQKFIIGDTVQGWTSLIILLCMIGGIQLLALGLIGEYIAKIYEESKGRPLYTIQSKIHPNS